MQPRAISCPSCSAATTSGAKFCSECGTRLAETCHGCGMTLSPKAKFCAECGQAVATPVRAAEPARPPSHPADEGERRHLTVMFCDLVDSTRLAEGLDPEDLRTVMRRFHAACSREVAAEDGHVAQYLGDGMLVFFGYPRAHEDDPQRAVRAGLAIIERVKQESLALQESLGVGLSLRVGINSGPVVVGEAGDARHHETQALGATMHLAARLQSAAPQDGVVISAATQRLVHGLFETRDLGLLELKGLRQPVPAFHVIGTSEARSRLDLAASHGLTAMAGRRQEIETVTRAWEETRSGRGRCVLVEGEAGIGKSRLVRVLRDAVGETPHQWIECRGAAQHVDSALYPLIDVLERSLGFERGEGSKEKLAKLERELTDSGFDLGETLPLFASLLSLDPPEGVEPLLLTPTVQRRRTLALLERWLVERSKRHPTLLIVEDLHWVDPSTLEFLDGVVDRINEERLLFVATFRPSFAAPWRSRPGLSHLVLEPLGPTQVREMIADLSHGKRLPDEVIDTLVSRTDGTPVFIEELTRNLLESEILEEHDDRFELTGPLPQVAIPATLHDSLTARLDRLSPVKNVAQLAATIGRAFSFELLDAVSELSPDDLREALARLVDAEILLERGNAEQRDYVFRHALIQEAAYDSLLRSRRRESHGRIAEVLQRRFPEIGNVHPEIIAHHLQHAGQSDLAIASWRAAGMRAMGRSAMVEAVRHFRHALEILQTHAADTERDRLELQLQAALSLPVIATAGYGTREAQDTIKRAQELCDKLDDAPEHFPVLRGVWTYYEIRGEYDAARDVADKLMELATSAGNPLLEVGALHSIGITNLFVGEFDVATPQFERAVSLYDPEAQKAAVSLTPMDPCVGAYGFGGLAMWFAGLPDQASAFAERSIPLADELGSPFNISWSLILSSWVNLLNGQFETARDRAHRAVEISLEQGFGNSAAQGALTEGAARTYLGDIAGGLAQLREGLDAWRAVGTEMGRTQFLCWFADACLRADRLEEGLGAIGEAFGLVERGPERFVEPELHRVRGEIQLAEGHRQAGLASLAASLEAAERIASPSQELRAATSLLRHSDADTAANATRRLRGIHAAFAEGHDSHDHRQAAELLASRGA